MTQGPNDIFGTNIPSITSRWSHSAPAASALFASSPSLEKSQARTEGEIFIIRFHLPFTQAAKIFFPAAQVQKRRSCGKIRHFPQKSEKRIFCRIVTVEKAPYHYSRKPVATVRRGYQSKWCDYAWRTRTTLYISTFPCICRFGICTLFVFLRYYNTKM